MASSVLNISSDVGCSWFFPTPTASRPAREVETAIYNTLPDNLDRLIKRHPLKRPVAFICGRQSTEMQQVGMAMTDKLAKGRISMLDGSHLFPHGKALRHGSGD